MEDEHLLDYRVKKLEEAFEVLKTVGTFEYRLTSLEKAKERVIGALSTLFVGLVLLAIPVLFKVGG